MALLLASGSPQRRVILTQLGVPFRVWVPDLQEVSAGDPWNVALHNSRLKAEAGKPHAAPDELVVGTDTLVCAEGAIHGKPQSRHEARAMLEKLRGAQHEVVSGLTMCMDGTPHGLTASTQVRFRNFDDAVLEEYLASGEWQDRAGGYAIQGRGAALVESVSGDFYNVVGFPVAAFLDLVDELGARERLFSEPVGGASA